MRIKVIMEQRQNASVSIYDDNYILKSKTLSNFLIFTDV